MKTTKFLLKLTSVMVAMFLFLNPDVAFSQVTQPDSSKITKTDTLNAAMSDSLKTIQAAPALVPAATVIAVPGETPSAAPAQTKAEPAETQKATEGKTDDDPDKKKDKKGKKNEIILYSGANFTKLSSSDKYESEAEIGYQLGAYYKQGRMFYWQAGARYASAKIGYKPGDSPAGTDFGSFTVSDIQIPLTLGINFTSFMNRVLSVRLFASVVPAFTLKAGNNTDSNYNITTDNVNSFILYGQGGLGINVAFLVLEAGYNQGFNELLIENTDSKPGQVFINLGFRF
jgi:hypothetical protein